MTKPDVTIPADKIGGLLSKIRSADDEVMAAFQLAQCGEQLAQLYHDNHPSPSVNILENLSTMARAVWQATDEAYNRTNEVRLLLEELLDPREGRA